jgi:hypothetical protein
MNKYVERAIQRIKTFHILDGEEKLPMKDIAEQIFTICAYLVNLQSPIVKKLTSNLTGTVISFLKI